MGPISGFCLAVRVVGSTTSGFNRTPAEPRGFLVGHHAARGKARKQDRNATFPSRFSHTPFRNLLPTTTAAAPKGFRNGERASKGYCLYGYSGLHCFPPVGSPRTAADYQILSGGVS